MDFNIRKPAHIFALVILIIVFIIIVILPTTTFILSFYEQLITDQIEKVNYPEYVLILSSIITILIFVGTPLIWYFLVNKFTIKEMLYNLKLRSEKIDSAFLWGVIAAISMLIIVVCVGSLLYYLGVDQKNLSNIKDLAGNLSIFTMLFIIIFQSISEEIFFRGFLLEKIDSIAGEKIAIFSTAILFGVAHLAYGKIYPTIMPMIMGIILGYIVLKTKNLYAAITAHMIFNFASFFLYIISQNLPDLPIN